MSTGIKVDQVAGSRGCPFHCKFCNFAINPWGVKRSWTPRSAESIVAEIEQIDADLILFVDDVFTYQPDRVVAICDLLIAKGIRKHYIVNARLELGDRPDVLAKMEQAGFIALLVGVESTQDATLRSMGKGFTIAQVRQRFQVLRKSKMVINAYFIVGNIGETDEQMFSTAAFARSLGVDLIHVSRLRTRRIRECVNWSKRRPATTSTPTASSIATPSRPSTSPICASGSIGGSTVLCKWHTWCSSWRRILNSRVKAKALLTIPFFLTQLIGTQTAHKVRKWVGMPLP